MGGGVRGGRREGISEEGNVKALVNGWILRSDILSYQKSTGILSAEGNIRKNGLIKI